VTKPSTSKSIRRKGKKSKFVLKPKQVWQVKQRTVNWLDLPSDVMANILSRVGVFDILDNAQKVCTTWHQICKEPTMWRAVSMDYTHRWGTRSACLKICKHVVDRSQGQMVDISIKHFCDNDLLSYIADRYVSLFCFPVCVVALRITVKYAFLLVFDSSHIVTLVSIVKFRSSIFILNYVYLIYFIITLIITFSNEFCNRIY